MYESQEQYSFFIIPSPSHMYLEKVKTNSNLRQREYITKSYFLGATINGVKKQDQAYFIFSNLWQLCLINYARRETKNLFTRWKRKKHCNLTLAACIDKSLFSRRKYRSITPLYPSTCMYACPSLRATIKAPGPPMA